MAKIVKVFKRNNKVVTETPYNSKFVEFARESKAKWNSNEKTWTFKKELNEIREKVIEIYSDFLIIDGKYDRDVIYDDLIENKATWGECSTNLKEALLKGNKKSKFIIEDGKLWYKWSSLCFKQGFKIDDNGNISIEENAVFEDFFEN